MEYRTKATVMDAEAISRAVTRIAHEILEANKGAGNLALVGIVTRGAVLAEMLAEQDPRDRGRRGAASGRSTSASTETTSPSGSHPEVHRTDIPFDVEGKDIILVDDVLFTGRTIRSAMDAIMDYGRPCSIQLAVLVDRGHRELPIRADYVGKNVPSSRRERVKVYFEPTDGRDAVEILERADGGEA